jgi:hypothetical protein
LRVTYLKIREGPHTAGYREIVRIEREAGLTGTPHTARSGIETVGMIVFKRNAARIATLFWPA